MPDTSVPPQQGPLEGRLLADRYHLTHLIASGGMAQVWEAVDQTLGRSVAVKLLHPHLAADPAFVERFRREAIAAARLSDPSIVAIYDTCSSDGMEAIVMELVRGSTLRDRIDDRDNELDPATIATIVSQVAGALEVAHQAGLVHRDIKPANILLCEDQRVKVADFGIAKLPEGADITQKGTFVGTVRYLAPEQVDGRPVDPRTDVYALGVVLYECLCGRPPFDGDTDVAVALARLHSRPLRPRQVRASVPRPLDQICMRALAQLPEDRFQSAADFRASLEATPLAEPRAGPGPGDAAGAAAIGRAGPGPTTDQEPAISAAGASAPAGDVPPPSFARAERRWLVPTLLIVLIAGALGVAGVLLGRTGAGVDLVARVKDAFTDGAGDSAATPPAIEGATAFDPDGSGGESDGLAPLAIDGNAATAWPTEGYDTRQLGGLKDGVGIFVTLTERAVIQRIEVVSPTPGWSAEVYIADEPGTTLDDWGEPVVARSALDGDASFNLGGVSGRAVLLWITDLGDGGPPFRVEIAEIDVVG